MSNTKSSSRKPKALFVAACVTLVSFGFIGNAMAISATIVKNADLDSAFNDSNAFMPWDGGFAAVQKTIAADAVSAGKTAGAVSVSAAAPATLAGIAGSQVINWSFSLDNLLQRMGEVRLENLAVNNGGDLHYNGNLWARAYGSRVNADAALTGASFHEYTYGLSLGADKAFQRAHGTILLGLMGDVSKTDRTFDAAGDGSSRNAGIGLYAAMFCARGWFADLAGRVDALKTKFSLGSPATSGNYNTNTQTLSLEAGRTVKRADGWWFEPSLQAAIAWFGSANTDATTDGQNRRIRVALDSSRVLQYRAALRFGRQLGVSRWHPYGKLAAAKIDASGGAVSIDNAFTLPSNYDGIRVEFGLGTIYRVDEFNQIYFDYNYAKALNYTSPWAVNLGYRLLW